MKPGGARIRSQTQAKPGILIAVNANGPVGFLYCTIGEHIGGTGGADHFGSGVLCLARDKKQSCQSTGGEYAD